MTNKAGKLRSEIFHRLRLLDYEQLRRVDDFLFEQRQAQTQAKMESTIQIAEEEMFGSKKEGK